MKDGRRWVIRIIAAVALGLFALWVSRPMTDDFMHLKGEAFATPYHITYADGPGLPGVQRAVDAELARIDAMASTWRDDSELMRYNRAADPQGFELSAELASLIERAKQIEVQTGGAFTLRPDGALIDLSGIAKGYAVDRVVELLQREFDITDCIVDIGGEVKAIGNGPSGDGWRVELYMPTDAERIKPPVLQLRDMSVATSGTYFKSEHLIDPATGNPVENELLSATVVRRDNTSADALATALYVMGPDRGITWAEANGVHVIYLLKDGSQRESRPE